MRRCRARREGAKCVQLASFPHEVHQGLRKARPSDPIECVMIWRRKAKVLIQWKTVDETKSEADNA